MNSNLTGKINELTEKVLSLGRNELLLKSPYLSRALFELEPVTDEKVSFETDGKYLYFDAALLLSEYRIDPAFVLRFWLHPLMHCLFLHMFVDRTIDREAWNLACDIAAEAMIADLDREKAKDPIGRLRDRELSKIAGRVQPMTAECLYDFLMTEKLDKEEVRDWERLFAFDDHSLWYRQEQKGKGPVPKSKGRRKTARDLVAADEENGEKASQPQDQASVWKHISRYMENDLKTFSKEYGDRSGDLVRALESFQREKTDYREFLKKFARRSEVLKISPDEFDYIFYSYGFELYKDTPLIEPLEYSEDRKIHDLAIVIDTSGSCQGETVQMFLQKTFNILKQEESFEKHFNLHIIQCDSEVKRDDLIRNAHELDTFLEGLELKGFGGTDFRPAIEYVEELVREGRFHKLMGLLYFTDGLGVYPEKAPPFLTSFVFIDHESAYYAQLPPWAIRVLLTRKELEIL